MKSMKIAIPFAVPPRKTEPSSDIAVITHDRRREQDARAARSTCGHHDALGAGDHDGDDVDDEDVDGTDAGGGEEAREQHAAPTDRPDDERLQEPALGVAGHGSERQEDGQHDAEEERREHRHPDHERARERALVDAASCRHVEARSGR